MASFTERKKKKVNEVNIFPGVYFKGQENPASQSE